MQLRSNAIAGAAALFLAAFAFLALLGWAEYSNWRIQVARTQAGLEQTARAIVQHADDVVDMTRLPMASLINEVVDEHEGADPDKIHIIIMRLLSASSIIGNLSYVDTKGHLVATSTKAPRSDANLSDRDYFIFHRNNVMTRPVVGKPILSRVSGQWIIPVTQRVTMDDGSFGGIVISAVPVSHFVGFFNGFDIGANGYIMLLRGDGVVLAREPAQESLLGTVSEFGTVIHLPAGPNHNHDHNHDMRIPAGNDVGIAGIYQSSHSGLTVIATSSQTDEFRSWMKSAQARWSYAAVLLLVIALALVYWRRQAKLRSEAVALMAAREAEFRLLAESSSDMISRFDADGIREYVSPASRVVLGIDPKELVGKSVFARMRPEALMIVRPAADRLLSGQTQQEKFVTRHIKPSGEEVWLETALSALADRSGHVATRLVAVTRDVTRSKLQQDALDLLANSDELTGLANRRFFNARLEQMTASAIESGAPVSLLMIDADHFKLFNDTYGHAAGDRCLSQIAGVIRRCIHRTGDVAARYGGEELAVLLFGTDAAGAEEVAESIRAGVAALAIPHEKNMPFECVTVSVGTGTAIHSSDPAGGFNAADLFADADADAALYKAKARGRNRIVCGTRSAVLLRSVL